MKNIYITLLLLIAYNLGYTQNYEWLNTSGGSNSDEDLESTIDNNDNIIYGGVFTSDTMFIRQDTLVNEWAPNPAGFLIKNNSNGNILWAKILSSPTNLNFSGVSGIDTDSFGNVYVTGSYGGDGASVHFGNNVQVSTPNNAAFYVVKFSPSGIAIWAKSGQLTNAASGQGAKGRSIVVDDLGNSYVGCNLSGATLTIDGQLAITNPTFPADNSVILNFAPNGTITNSYITGAEGLQGSRMAMTPDGNIIHVTQFENQNLFVGSSNLINPNSGTTHGVIIKFTPNLNVIWAKAFGSESNDEFIDVDVDNLGNIYVAGLIEGNWMQFGATTINNSVPILGVIAKFNSEGNKLGVITTTSANGNGISAFTNIDIVNHNEMYVSCLFELDETFLGQTSVAQPNYLSGFLARIDSSGEALWMHVANNADSILFLAVEHDQSGNIYLGGSYTGTGISLGTQSASNTLTGPYDVFFAKLNNACSLNLSISTQNAACGDNSGSALANVIGGSGSYAYQWTSGDSTQTASSLIAGIYQVTILDESSGCEVSGVAMVSDNGGATITASPAGSNHVTCPGGNDGQILINLVGGQAPRTISWSNGDTTLLINNLTAGPYDVTVEDGNGCITTQSYNVTEPDGFNLSYTTTDASCGITDGEANVHVEGGTSPYTYAWSPGAGTDTSATGLDVGSYTFSVSDDNGCSNSVMVMVNEANGPIITIDSVLTASCLNGNGGSVYISISGQPGPYTYQWTNGGGTNEDLVGVMPGNYAVMVTSGNNCSSMMFGPVSEELPEPQPLCMVTVDTVTGYNLVVWEKPIVGHISHYNIYQEQTQAGVFNYVGSNQYADESQFVDSLANPMIRSYRYKVSAVDTCGVESELSWEHKTVHMVMSTFGGDNYISWDNYEGFTYASFEVWKYSDQAGWSILYTLPSNLNSCTDPAPTGTNINYYIAAVPNEICSTTKAQDHNSTRSNRHTAIDPNANTITEVENGFVSLFPNPTKDLFTIELANGSANKWSVEVYDISGKTVAYQRALSTNNYVIDLSKSESGVYLVRIQIGNKMVFHKVIKQ